MSIFGHRCKHGHRPEDAWGVHAGGPEDAWGVHAGGPEDAWGVHAGQRMPASSGLGLALLALGLVAMPTSGPSLVRVRGHAGPSLVRVSGHADQWSQPC